MPIFQRRQDIINLGKKVICCPFCFCTVLAETDAEKLTLCPCGAQLRIVVTLASMLITPALTAEPMKEKGVPCPEPEPA